MNGLLPLSWQDINEWQQATQRELPLWNILVLKNMSKAYVAEYHAAEDAMRPAPYTDTVVEITEELRDKVGMQTKSLFADLRARQNNQ